MVICSLNQEELGYTDHIIAVNMFPKTNSSPTPPHEDKAFSNVFIWLSFMLVKGYLFLDGNFERVQQLSWKIPPAL